MKKLGLDGTWVLEYVDYGEGTKRGLHHLDYEPQTPLEARVPGEVHLDLMRAGIIEEPLYGRNALKQAWIEDKEFWYRKKFSLPQGFRGKRVELIFSGLDLDSHIYLNGEKIGAHHNMHTPCAIDVTGKLKDKNIVIVRLDSGIKATQNKSLQPYPGRDDQDYRRVWTRKAQFTYGWDWAPRLLNAGIWRSVELICYEKVALRDIFVYPTLSPDYKKATLHISGFLENFTEEEWRLHVEAGLKSGEENFCRSCSVTAYPGLNRMEISLDVDNPHLWWPHPLGEPFMYEFFLKVKEENFLLDEYRLPMGLREISLVQSPLSEEEGSSFTIQINGVNVFCKGADWVPPDSVIVRVDKEKHTKLIDMAHEAHFNMLRVWGGGIYEDPYFYEYCARRGIMVWQDFMFACAYYPNNPQFLKEVENEVEVILKRLRNHTGIVLWCGNNELQWIHKLNLEKDRTLKFTDFPIYHRIIPRLCAALDPSRPYWFSSPYGGDDPCSEYEGNRHAWEISLGVTREQDKLNYKLYSEDKGKFITEFGILSGVEKKNLQRFIPEKELTVGSPTWQFHNNRFERGSIRKMLKVFYKDPVSLSFEEYLLFSMLVQAEALKYALDHWRRRKFYTAGSLFWMYSDSWGATGSWTVVDYYLARKPSFYYVKKSFAPLSITFKEIEGGLSIYGLNDTLKDCKGRLDWGLSTFDGEAVDAHRETILIPANASERIAEIRFPSLKDEDRRSMFYWARFWEKGKPRAKDRYFLTTFGKLKLPSANVKYEVNKVGDQRYIVKLTADTFAWFVRITVNDRAWLSDNYFDLFPREEKELILENVSDQDIKKLSLEWNNK